MPRLYGYVGPEEIRRRCAGAAGGRVIASAADLLDWLRRNDPDGAATFVIDVEGRLMLAPRRSEHVACARGGPVRSAGEMFFEGAELVEVSNHRPASVLSRNRGRRWLRRSTAAGFRIRGDLRRK